ncbi:restriction endonuclease [Sphingomonas tabacisoli]|uniref:Restriction endonuclease n=1 Tax=Sphingomonas tabacisoli TaxID=2249466 RepID=A0ABW4I7J1_9SPHN
MWKVNAGKRSRLSRQFLDNARVAIGWREMGDPTTCRSRAAAIEQVSRGYPEQTEKQNEVGGGNVWRFLGEMKVGDEVITYDPIERLYHIGVVTGEPVYDPQTIPELPTFRSVSWKSSVSRDVLSADARNRLGSLLTVIAVPEVTGAELRALAQGKRAAPQLEKSAGAEVAEADDPYAAIEDQALERIKDRLLGLAWEDMQEIVAALLRSLGYRTIVSPTGPDRGKDIVASRDGFGFEAPRIVVEVKHRKGQMGAPEIRAFLGGRHAEDRGLYVSTGGFSREAHFEAERAATVTHLMTLDGLARALVDNYHTLDERGRALLPLTRIYWPA